MKISFFKYQGTGNDFILINQLEHPFELTRAQIAELCDRRFGIGGDGLIVLRPHPELDFEMKNYNADGGECSMCGNGARCLVQFAFDQGMHKSHFRFMAIDGEHEARREGSVIQLKMQDVLEVRDTPVGACLDTGSPHLVCKVEQVMDYPVVEEGRRLRNLPQFLPGGVNVNFVEYFHKSLFVRTYERGVEDETLSCGTGIIASALMAAETPGAYEFQVQARGGTLEVRFEKKDDTTFENIWLVGPAKLTFQGSLELQK